MLKRVDGTVRNFDLQAGEEIFGRPVNPVGEQYPGGQKLKDQQTERNQEVFPEIPGEHDLASFHWIRILQERGCLRAGTVRSCSKIQAHDQPKHPQWKASVVLSLRSCRYSRV